MIEVWTSRLSTRDPDAFNITRKSGNPTFAPSWALLRTALEIREQGRVQTPEEWRMYAAEYLREMGVSYKARREVWDGLLSRPRVVLTCYCTDSDRCHRKLMALSLTKLGAIYRGELPDSLVLQRAILALEEE